MRKEGSMQTMNFNDTKLKWVFETPYDICDKVMNDLLKGYSSDFAANHKKFQDEALFQKGSSTINYNTF